MVILFADIRGFTPLAETLSPEATLNLVNRHFALMIDVIQAHRGIIVDFLGDAILAFFDPLDAQRHRPAGDALCRGKYGAGEVKEEERNTLKTNPSGG